MIAARRSLAFRVLTPIVAFGLVLCITALGFVYFAVSRFVEQQATNDLRWRSFGVHHIIDSSLDELQRSGKASDEVAVRQRKVHTLMAIEDFARVNELDVTVNDLAEHRTIEIGIDLPDQPPPASLFERVFSTDLRFYTYTFRFEPWHWDVTLQQENRAYLGLFNGLLWGIGSSAVVLVAGITGFMYYITVLTGRPIRKIISDLERNQRPKYQGIAEFEYLGQSIATMMDAIREKSDLLQATFAHMNEGLCVFDSELRCLSLNTKFREIYGLTADTGSEHPAITDVLSNALALARYLSSERTEDHFTLEHTRPSGRVIEVHINAMGDGRYVSTHEDVTERKTAEARIRHLATYDVLTDLPNRFLFQDRLHQALATTRRAGGRGGVLFIDLDRFKDVNDTLGHEVGDQLLKETAARINGAVRESDTTARFGGDEFAVMIPQVEDAHELASVAEKLIEALGVPFVCRGSTIQSGASIGITVFPDDGTDVIRLLRNADISLYEAKGAGRGQYRFFTETLNARVQERATLQRDLRRALEKREFMLRYQPQIDLKSRKVVGVEALLRWNHPQRGVLTPMSFIPLAEQTGTIIQIGDWVLRQACAQAQEWFQHDIRLRVAVNVSPVQIRHGDIVRAVAQAIRDFGLAPEQLELEITESAFLEDPENTIAVFQKLRELGVRVSLDDFGTGYSSLSYLRRLPLSDIKIDSSFVRDMNARAADATIVRAIIELAHGLGNIRVIAEGVENWKQYETLIAMHCDEGQGFLLCGPVSEAEILGLPSRRAVNDESGTSFRLEY